MKQSPGGHDIEYVKGTPSKIKSRGTQITQLGDKMLTSADLLKSIGDGASGQKGLAVKKLEDVVGDVHKELKKAGEMYQPTGPVVFTYGEALEDIQPKIKDHVDECESLWEKYQELPGYYAGDFAIGTRPTIGMPNPGSPEAASAATDDAAKEAAYKKWETEAGLFDTDYGTWDDAFDKAAKDVGNILEGKIEDGFWDKVDGAVGIVLEVLKWVGVVLVIAAILIGGPIIAALAAIVAITVLIGTLYQKGRGDASWKDVALAAIGVIPFGSLGKLGTKFSGNMKFLDDAAGGLLTGAGRSAIKTEISTIIGSGKSAFKFTGSGATGMKNSLAHFTRNHGADGRTVDSIARFFTGKSASAIGSAKPSDILFSTTWTHLARVNSGLSTGTGQGLWARLSD